MSLDAWSIAVPVLLAAVLVPVLRGCAWRTAAALALVFATMTACGPAWEWQHGSYEVSDGAMSVRWRNVEEGEDGPRGTQKPFSGEVVVVLGFLAAVASLRLTIRPERTSRSGSRASALAASILLGCASAWTLYEILAHARGEPRLLEEGLSVVPVPALGIRLTLLAAVLGPACAERLYVLLRARAVPSTSPATP